MFQLKHDKHPHEEAVAAAFAEADPRAAQLIREARQAGIPLSQIIQLILTYGPQFYAIIKAIIDALKTPIP